MKKRQNKVSLRLIVTGILIVLEICWSSVLLHALGSLSPVLYHLMCISGLLMALKLIVTGEKTVYTGLWVAFLIAVPSQSFFFYCLFNKMTWKGRLVSSSFKKYSEKETRYYSCGEKFFADLIREVKKSERYIFLEYFIISDGIMWETLLSILSEKSENGVDVRIIYDDLCSSLFSLKKISELKRCGIAAVPFNRMRPFPDIGINRRNHRKIAVIDGKTAFTGGINIADEYINIKSSYGYWKDAAVMIRGGAAGEMAYNFAGTWRACTGERINLSVPEISEENEKGFLIPFEDSPFNMERLSKKAYVKLTDLATEYVYIMTPYFIPDRDMTESLCRAAERGTDVRIITPYLPDKKYVHLVTRSYYLTMLSRGVRIYEYTPGFIHSKALVSDDTSAVIGTANLDYRSFYLLYENNVVMYRCAAVRQLKEDFENTFGESRQITAENFIETSGTDRIFGKILKIFSCIM